MGCGTNKCHACKRKLKQLTDGLNNDNVALQATITKLQNQPKHSGGLCGGSRGAGGCELPDEVTKIIAKCFSTNGKNLIKMWRENVLRKWNKCAEHGNRKTRAYSLLDNMMN